MNNSGATGTGAVIRTAGDGMNNRVIRTKDGRVYYCAMCPYRDTLTGFCGFCMQKILDDARKKKENDLDKQSPLADTIIKR